MNDLVWRAAQDYLARGWSVLPMKPKQKLTTLAKWTSFQSSPATLEQLREWFTGPRPARRLGLIMGQVSGGLAIRDFDQLEAYKAWAAKFPDLAKTLPTVRTGRGRHVYFRTNAAILEPLGRRKGALEFADGELRAWNGCYTLAPPSRHDSGVGYDWLIPLSAVDLPLVDPAAVGMIGQSKAASKSEPPARFHRAEYWADKFPPACDADWRLLVKLDLALQRKLVNENVVMDSMEAARQCGATNPWADFTQTAKGHCEGLGVPWASIQAIRVPEAYASNQAPTRRTGTSSEQPLGQTKIADCLEKLMIERGYDKPAAKPKRKAKCHTEDSTPEDSGIPAVPEGTEAPANAANPRERILQDVIKGRKKPLSFAPEIKSIIVELVAQTIPQRHGQRHRQIFEFCRALQGIRELADAEGVQLETAFRYWYKEALPMIATKAWEENWFDFLESWDKVEYPYGADRVDLAFERSIKNPLPAESEQFEQLPVKQLLALCRELQILRNGEPFFLSARTAAKLFKTDPTTISRWLRGFQKVGLLHLVKIGTHTTRQASEYFYLGEIAVSQGSEWG